MADILFHADEQQRAFADFLMVQDGVETDSELYDFLPSEIYSILNTVSQGKSYTKSDKNKLNEFTEKHRDKIARVWKKSEYNDSNSS